MSRIELTELLVRIFAVFQAVTFASMIPAYASSVVILTTIVDDPSAVVPWGALALFLLTAVVLPLAVALLLWQKSAQISFWLWRPRTVVPDQEPQVAPISFEQVQITVFSGIGLYLLVSSVPSLFYSVASFVYRSQVLTDFPDVAMLEFPTLAGWVGQVVEIAIAVALLLGPGRLVALLTPLWRPRPAA